MAATPERKVKQAVVKLLKELGCYYFYPVTGGYGSSGVPDIIGCYRGYFFGIECKAGKGTTTALQDMNLQAIRDTGGFALVVNESNLEDVTALMKHIQEKTHGSNTQD